ncbi:MAG: ABC transporter permease [Chloroflexota bacterium]
MTSEQSSGTSSPQTIHQIIIQPSRGWTSLGLRDVWEYRELLYFTVLRDIQGRYRQTAFGFTWLFLQPVINVLVLSLTFGTVVKVPSDGLPYPLFSLAALLPWGYFAKAAQRSANSLVENMQVISKVYFPRLIVPLAAVLSGLIEFAASFLILLVAMLVYHTPLRWEILWTVPLLLVSILFALAVGLWLATLSAMYRDVNFAVAFMLQALMYASPVIYPVSLIPERFRLFYYLNPMTGVIEGFRWALLGSGSPPGGIFLLSVGIILLLLVSGAYIFRRTERNIVDIL